MEQLAAVDPGTARALIAREWLRATAVDSVLGAVRLRRHQIDAVSRLRELLASDGGALLCDEVGLGKTYVALAVARHYARPVVVAPASLRDMWAAAAGEAEVAIRFVSTESLSRGASAATGRGLIIVDEAHHFRTPSTARYRRLAALCARSKILFLSATPLHNRRSDVTSLLSLFRGSAARALPDRAVARLIVRRGHAAPPDGLPTVKEAVHITVPSPRRQLRDLLALPPPFPASDGCIAAALVARNLVRLWSSSDAALREGLRRRLARTIAIRDALENGRHPTRADLRAWVYADGSMQLGFATLLSSSVREPSVETLSAVRAHEYAVTGLLARVSKESAVDRSRVLELRAIRARHHGARVIAFSQFSHTVAMYYSGLASEGRVAMLTSRGARIASGSITRREALERFAPMAHGVKRPRRAEKITLLLATDLLSEGVNLQDASVVVHLDLPWTAAAVEQRVGRAARLGSRHREVFVYCFDPPASSEELLRAESIIRIKASLADASIGASRIPPLFAPAEPPASAVEDTEAIRRTLGSWLTDAANTGPRPVFACAAARRDGVVALLFVRGELVLIGGFDGEISADVRVVRDVVELATGACANAGPALEQSAVQSVQSWMNAKLASDDAGSLRSGRSALARKLGARLARNLAACPRHERSLRATRIAALHQRMQAPFTLGVEREIEDLLKSGRTDDFVTRLEGVIRPGWSPDVEEATGILAVLILKREDASPTAEKTRL